MAGILSGTRGVVIVFLAVGATVYAISGSTTSNPPSSAEPVQSTTHNGPPPPKNAAEKAQDAADAKAREDEWNAKEGAQDNVRAMLKDPDSAEFGPAYQLGYDKDGNVTAVCGTVNAKNSFGAFTGYATFISFARFAIVSNIKQKDIDRWCYDARPAPAPPPATYQQRGVRIWAIIGICPTDDNASCFKGAIDMTKEGIKTIDECDYYEPIVMARIHRTEKNDATNTGAVVDECVADSHRPANMRVLTQPFQSSETKADEIARSRLLLALKGK